MFPISKFAFTLKAIQKLFLVRTKDSNLFDEEKIHVSRKNEFSRKHGIPEAYIDSKIANETKKHYPVRLDIRSVA